MAISQSAGFNKTLLEVRTLSKRRKWILWRIMAHDLHHGGELAVTLGLQGIALPELGDEATGPQHAQVPAHHGAAHRAINGLCNS